MYKMAVDRCPGRTTRGWPAATFFHVLLHSVAGMAYQEPKLEIYILIFRAPRAGLAPDSWLAQQTEIATDQKCFFSHFWKMPPGSCGSPGAPRGSRGVFITRKRSSGPQKKIYQGPDAQFWQENAKKSKKWKKKWKNCQNLRVQLC